MVDPLPLPPYKVVLLGELLVGKTSLVNRFTTNEFDPHVSNTIGAAFISRQYTSLGLGRLVELQIWDTAGQERYRLLTPMYYRNAKCALICVDLSLPQELLELARYWLDQLKLHDQCRIKLVGTKLDVAVADDTSVQEFADASELKLYPTSSKTGDGIDAVFDAVVDEIDPQFFSDWDARKQLDVSQSTATPTTSRCC